MKEDFVFDELSGQVTTDKQRIKSGPSTNSCRKSMTDDEEEKLPPMISKV